MSGRFSPMHAFAHPIEDAIERVTHSICTLDLQFIVHCTIGYLRIGMILKFRNKLNLLV